MFLRRLIEPKPDLAKWGLLVGSILLIVFREFAVVVQPNFWAEEGTRYFAYAYSHSWFHALLNVQLGYFAAWPNIATTIAAKLVPLQFAPSVTTGFALIAQLIPIAIIIWSRSEFWRGTGKKLLGILIVLFTPISREIWLNTINSQFYFALATALVLLEDAPISSFRKWSMRGLLLVAGLTGVVSCFLLPLFLLRAWRENSVEHRVQAGILSVCTLVQLAVYALSYQTGTAPPRFGSLQFSTLIAIVWTQSISLLMFGHEAARQFSQTFTAIDALGATQFDLMSRIVLFAEVLFFVIVVWPLERRQRLTLLGSYFLILVPSVVFSLGDNSFALVTTGYAHRYFYVPNVILMLTILAHVQVDSLEVLRGYKIVLVAALLWMLSLGAWTYMSTPVWGNDWPIWNEEVTVWQMDSEHELRIWPPDWRIGLPAPQP